VLTIKSRPKLNPDDKPNVEQVRNTKTAGRTVSKQKKATAD
jgi:hypothetical protein